MAETTTRRTHVVQAMEDAGYEFGTTDGNDTEYHAMIPDLIHVEHNAMITISVADFVSREVWHLILTKGETRNLINELIDALVGRRYEQP